ncbi:tricarboxylate transport protein TctC [Geomicrobium sp. JCM 19037]|uniref:tripartite tricarboxylate transporter substrate binding protein n=1 Tax=unclassified Geomicrobium TaxID=2628951 RepID=UPI00045F3C63|nr:tripartite tricarboxylate transporter substrate binding protein [Geomicrobium sp. JCM 19037]GAK05337.1 tricarboxylate transport protein TctC [Geomicrobium sp. JCM 19037]
MKKYFLSLGMLVPVLGLVACGGDDSTDANGEDAAANFPSSSMEVIVPYAEGGGTDLVARAFADYLQDEIGESVSVSNREGGGGAVGMQAGANSTADGHSMTLVTVELLTLPHSGLADLNYEEDFKPVALLNEDSAAITVQADSEYETIDDFIEAVESGENLQIGNSGTGAIWHLAASALEQEIDGSFNHVPFEGAAPAVNNLLGGHIDAVSVSPAEVINQVESGDLRVLAVMADERVDALPDVPTLSESGIDLSIGTWRGITVPADTPDEVVDVLADAAAATAENEEFIERIDTLQLGYRYEDPAGFTELMNDQNSLFEELIPSLDLD